LYVLWCVLLFAAIKVFLNDGDDEADFLVQVRPRLTLEWTAHIRGFVGTGAFSKCWFVWVYCVLRHLARSCGHGSTATDAGSARGSVVFQ
jgi:hypothetical protein